MPTKVFVGALLSVAMLTPAGSMAGSGDVHPAAAKAMEHHWRGHHHHHHHHHGAQTADVDPGHTGGKDVHPTGAANPPPPH